MFFFSQNGSGFLRQIGKKIFPAQLVETLININKLMKKIIITSTLLTAGTLLGNAFTIETATGYVSLDGGKLTTSGGVTLSDDTTNGYTLSLTSGGDWTGVSAAGSRDDITFAFTFDCSKIVQGSEDMALFYVDGSAADIGIGWDFETQRFTKTWSAGNGTPDYDYSITTLKAEGWVTLVFTMGDSGARIYKDTGTGFWTKPQLKADIGTAKNIVVTSAAAAALDNLIVWNKDIAFSGGASDVGTALSASQSLIPEPSAFGLLAGLGALALTVSRRRR